MLLSLIPSVGAKDPRFRAAAVAISWAGGWLGGGSLLTLLFAGCMRIDMMARQLWKCRRGERC